MKPCLKCNFNVSISALFCERCGGKLDHNQEQKYDQNLEDPNIFHNFLDTYIGTKNNSFHEGQKEAIESTIIPGSKTLVVQKTGWGKSAVYFIVAKYLKLKSNKITVIVSPLLSLMKDQIRSVTNNGFLNIQTINSSQEYENMLDAKNNIKNNNLDILMISPERFSNSDFEENIFPKIVNNIGLFVIDEAHCLSQWGHDFRVDYNLLLKDILPRLSDKTSLLFTTATASKVVIDDLNQYLNIDKTLTGDLIRTSLSIINLGSINYVQSVAWIKKNLNQLNGSGIIYTLTVQRAQAFASWLRVNGINATAYHGRLEPHERSEIEQQFIDNKYKVVVSTSALGMGFDKPDIGFIIHLGMPKSLTDYYQQIGRAGRKLDNAICIIMSLPDDAQINDYFINQIVPDVEHVDALLNATTEEPDEYEVIKTRSGVHGRYARKLMKRLFLEGYLIHHGNQIYSKKMDIKKYDLTQSEKILRIRYEEWNNLLKIINSDQCLMLQIVSHFGQNISEDYKCLKCTNCTQVNIYEFPNKSDEENVISIHEIEEQYEQKSTNIHLSNKLKKYRKRISLDNHIPEFGIFNNKELNVIVSNQPKNINDLEKIGLSKYTIARYGEAIIKMLTPK
jgi:ATP-dependent DNA helicase RecQ